jgi:hypothetical protein
MALGGTFTRMVSGSLNAPRKRGWGKMRKHVPVSTMVASNFMDLDNPPKHEYMRS